MLRYIRLVFQWDPIKKLVECTLTLLYLVGLFTLKDCKLTVLNVNNGIPLKNESNVP